MAYAGLRVAKYTSPHLVNFNERILVAGVPMPRARIAAWLNTYEPLLIEIGATFFEATTSMALAYFAEQAVDVAIIEVGLGGRLDATNIVKPVSTGVTQIGYDHVEFLGSDLSKIALEKAGIFKPNVPAVIGEQRPDIQDVMIAEAHRLGASTVHVSGRDWHVQSVAPSVNGTAFAIERNGVSRHLQTPRGEQLQQVADVQARGRRVEPHVVGDRPRRQLGAQCVCVRRVRDETTRVEVVQYVGHGDVLRWVD